MSSDGAAFAVRKLEITESDTVAFVLRASFDDRLPWLAGLHTPEEDRAFVSEHLFQTCELFGAFAPDLVGVIAFRPGWIDQLYVLPGSQGRGVGSALLAKARAENVELQLWTFQCNTGAREFYEGHGFVAIDKTDGAANEEREPDILYRWVRDRHAAAR